MVTKFVSRTLPPPNRREGKETKTAANVGMGVIHIFQRQKVWQHCRYREAQSPLLRGYSL